MEMLDDLAVACYRLVEDDRTPVRARRDMVVEAKRERFERCLKDFLEGQGCGVGRLPLCEKRVGRGGGKDYSCDFNSAIKCPLRIRVC